MEEVEDRQGDNLSKYNSQMFRQEIYPLARNSIIANSLKQCTFFFSFKDWKYGFLFFIK